MNVRLLIERAIAAHEAGYEVVADHGKAAIFAGWQNAEVTAEMIRSWEHDSRVTNIGIRTGEIVGIDIDIMDPALSERAKNLALQILGDTSLVRIGLQPKQLLVYQTIVPIRKKTVVGVTSTGKHTIEILGRGQKFTAYGRHPDTLQPYVWTEADLCSVPAANVPHVTEEALTAYLAAVVDIIGPPPKPKPTPPSRPYVNGHDKTDAAEALEALYAIPGDLDYDEWVRVGMALHAALGSAGASHWAAWSARSSKNVPATTNYKWPSFAGARDIHAETLFWIARDHGWRPEREKGGTAAELGIFKSKPPLPRHDPETGEILENEPIAEERPKAPAINPLPLRFWSELDQPVPPDRLVRRLFGINTLVEIYGPTASGKTFLTLDIAMHIALGRDWFGRPVTKGAVLYVASEGGASIENRLLAFRQHHGIKGDVPIAVVPVGINLGPGGKDAARVIEAARLVAERTGLPVLVIVIDTLARSMAGNENDAVDMGAFIMACDSIRVGTGATVLVVHHSGKDANAGSRGSTALPSAVDTLVKSEKGDEGNVATIEKQKDGVEGTRIGFKLKTIEIGTDEETGEPITSCVVVPLDGDVAAASRMRREPSGNAGVVLKALYMAVAESGEDAPASVHIPPFARIVPTDRWRDYAYRMMTDATPEARQRAFKRGSAQLISSGWVGSWSERVWISGKGNA